MTITIEEREAEVGRKTGRNVLGSRCGYGVPETHWESESSSEQERE